MTRLNQIIAVANGKKSKTTKDLTEVYKKIQKSALFEGISRTYQPLDDEGETFPPERKNNQYSVTEAISDATNTLAEMWDVVATQDWANTEANADVVVDGVSVLQRVPVTHLLFLEKQLVDVQTFVTNLPVLDPAETWHWSDASNCYQSEPASTNKTKKVMRNHVKSEATEKHPAQVEVFTEDVKVGEWTTVKFSGGIPVTEKNAVLERVASLLDAVKFAREQANMHEVTSKNVSQVFDYIFNTRSQNQPTTENTGPR